MFKLSVEANDDIVKVSTKAENEELVTMCYAFACAMADVARLAEVDVSEIILGVKIFSDLANFKSSENKHPDETL